MKKRGFTLLELLIVIIIIGILVAIALPRYYANLTLAKDTAAKATLNSIREAQLAVYAATNAYATTFPITATLGGSTISLAAITSPDFAYSIATAGCATADGGNDWYICYDSGKILGGLTCTCP